MSKRRTLGLQQKSIVGALALAAGAWLLDPTAAHAVGFDLGAFDFYGLLVNNGASGGDINTAPVNANIGIGNVNGPINLHNEVVNGQVDCSGTCIPNSVSGGNITGTQPVSRGGTPPGGSPASVNSNIANVQNAITAAQNLSSSLGAEAGTPVTINGTTTINANNGVLDANGNRIFTATSFSIGNGHTVTVSGTPSQFVVINVTGSNGNKLDGALTLTGGITPDHVIVNFLGSGQNLQGAANGATLSATFLVPNLGIQLNSLTIDGHLFGGEANTNFQFVSNAFIMQPPLNMVPLPAALPLFAAGLGMVGLLARRRSRGALPAAA